MRILVTSDTHGNTRGLRQAVLRQPEAEMVIHLGDGAEDLEDLKLEFPEKTFLQVCGNCDRGSTLPVTGTLKLEGFKIFYTHGHIYHVKQHLHELRDAARQQQAHIALFGHTHIPLTEYEDGLHLMNPGSLSHTPGPCGILDLTEAGIVTNLITI